MSEHQEGNEVSGNLSELVSRMLNKQAVPGYAIWFDAENTSYAYILEAPVAAITSDTGFRGIRIPLTASGNAQGKTQTNVAGTLTFSNRTTDGGWS